MRETGSPVEDLERLGEHDQGDRAPVPDVLAVRPRMALEKCALVDVQVPLRHADGEVAERVRADVDTPREQAVALLRGERPIVPDDVAHGIGHRLLLSAAIVRRGMRQRHRAIACRVMVRDTDRRRERLQRGEREWHTTRPSAADV